MRPPFSAGVRGHGRVGLKQRIPRGLLRRVSLSLVSRRVRMQRRVDPGRPIHGVSSSAGQGGEPAFSTRARLDPADASGARCGLGRASRRLTSSGDRLHPRPLLTPPRPRPTTPVLPDKRRCGTIILSGDARFRRCPTICSGRARPRSSPRGSWRQRRCDRRGGEEGLASTPRFRIP